MRDRAAREGTGTHTRALKNRSASVMEISKVDLLSSIYPGCPSLLKSAPASSLPRGHRVRRGCRGRRAAASNPFVRLRVTGSWCVIGPCWRAGSLAPGPDAAATPPSPADRESSRKNRTFTVEKMKTFSEICAGKVSLMTFKQKERFICPRNKFSENF